MGQTWFSFGWESQLLDMYMFTRANSVIAAKYSSFTQSAPLSYIFEKAKSNPELGNGTHPHYFCEFGSLGNYMDCFDNVQSWLKFEYATSFQLSDAKLTERNVTMSKRRVEILYPFDRPKGVREIKALFKGSIVVQG